MAVAYSYIRFSSAEQRKGDSLRRQQEESSRWAATHGITLDTSLNINDLGTSAYRGKNVVDGGLGAFLSAIDDGTVKKGSYLLVENFDRLTRMEPYAAFTLLQSIVSKGVIVVTLSDNRQYTAEGLNRDIASLLVSLITMHRAHEESRLKGARVRAAWTKKKQVDAREGKPITNMLPSWLSIQEGKFYIIEEKADVVRRVFALATDEGLGQRAIVTRLKKESIPTIGRNNMWTETSVRRIIQNIAVIGMYQPRSVDTNNPRERLNDVDAIEGYYPEIISKQQFYYAQTLREKAMIPRGPRGKSLGTIFTGLVFCGQCGSTMRRKGASANDVFNRLRCASSCGAPSWKYEVLEILVLGFFDHDLMPHLDNRNSERAQLQEKMNEAEQVLAGINGRIEKIVDAIQMSDDSMVALVSRLKKLELERADAELRVQRILSELRMIEARSFARNSDAETDGDGIREILASSPDFAPEKVRYALSRAIDKILLFDTKGTRSIRIEIGNETRNFDFDQKELMWTCREIQWKSRVVFKHPVTKEFFKSSP